MKAKNETTWRKVKLGDTLHLLIDHRGKTPKKLGGDWLLHGVPAISAKNIKNGQIVNDGDIRYVNQNLYDKWMPKKLEKGDILLTSEAPLGELLYLKEKTDYCLSQRLFALRTRPQTLYSRFLYYYLLSPIGRHQLLRRISGTAAEGIRQAELRQLDVAFPENPADQKCIADILSAFDDKIEINNKISRNLEQTAQTIFKEWFVKFNFPVEFEVKSEKLKVKSFGYKDTGGKMVDSELGKIPEGWKVKKVKDVAKIKKGLSYSSPEINEKSEGLPLINLANFQRGGGYNPLGIKFYTGRYSENHVVRSGDILIAMTDLTSNREVIGHPARVPINSWDKILISLDVCAFETDELYREYLYYLMLRKNFAYQMASSASGTNVAHLSKSEIDEFEFVLPAKTILENFKKFVEDIFRKQNLVAAENQKLAALRDLLLPKLMSGEIRV